METAIQLNADNGRIQECRQARIKPGLLDFLHTDLAIDLGTANTLVFTSRSGLEVNEPSIVAIDRDGTPVAIGAKALLIHEKSHSGIRTVRPLKGGVIADFRIAEHMIQGMIRSVERRWYSRIRRMVICVPSEITEVERRTVRESTKNAGAREVYLVDEPMAAAIGIGLDVHAPAGNMIVDIGGGTTEIAVISLSGIVLARSVRTGGDQIIESILSHFRRNHNLLIGNRTAESVLTEIGSAGFVDSSIEMTVKGRDLISGLPTTRTVNADDIHDAIAEPVGAIVDAISTALDQTPPEFAGDLLEQGIYLAGGGALLRNLDRVICEQTGVPARIAKDPLTAIVRGTGTVLNDLDSYRAALY